MSLVLGNVDTATDPGLPQIAGTETNTFRVFVPRIWQIYRGRLAFELGHKCFGYTLALHRHPYSG